ncbi:MAG: ABC transporter substrate-binding protein [Acidobacteria bacterium]|nr:ABC transporter substrate-binding protein [Acidobacteriota bacterium]MCA1640735.1 ABC transporter substrate-binding protein [Acidobacteriota bacterium]
MKNRSQRKPLLAALVAAACALAACQPTPQQNVNSNQSQLPREKTTGRRGGQLTYRVSAPPKTFNYVMSTGDDVTITLTLFLLSSRLVELDHDAQGYVPALAEEWKLGADARGVDVTLRDGLKFSDGHPLTSDDVAFTLRALYDQRLKPPIFRDALMTGEKPIGITVADARRFTLTFAEPVNVPENYMSNLAVVPRHVFEPLLDSGKLPEAYSVTSDPKSMVTSGKFVVESSAPGERVVLARNPFYWKKDSAGNQLPYLDRLALEVISDESNAIARLGQGSLDIYDRVRPADFASVRAGAGNARGYDLGPGLYADDLWFNLNPGRRADGKPYVDPNKLAWFTDVRFRRAVAHAIDREHIAQNVWQGLATPLSGFVTPGNHAWAATDLPRINYDLDKSRALLKEAGFVTRGTPESPELYDAKGNRVEFTVIAPAGTKTRVDSATVVQEDLAKLGMKITVAQIENAQLAGRINESFDYEAIFYGTSATEPDPSSYADVLRSNSPQHLWSPSQPKPSTEWEARIDELAARQAHETDRERRRAIFRDIQQIMAEQLPLIPIASRHIAVAANARVGNYRPSPLPPFSLWNAEELFVK